VIGARDGGAKRLAYRMHDSPHFVGREREVALVRARLNDAALGSGGALVFAGENGIGKTRLLRECGALRSPAVTVALRCGTGLPGGETPAQLARALRVPPARGQAPSLPAVLAAAGARSLRRPLAIFVDDAHLAAAGELRLLNTLATMAAGGRHRLTIVAATADRARRFAPEAEFRPLEPLAESAMQLLVRGLVHPAAQAVTERDIHAIVRVAQGNPRFGIELVAARTNGFASGTPLVAPSARAAVDALRPLLSKSEFEILCACSVVGDRFAPEWIVQISGRPRASVADALQTASDLGVLVEAGGVPGWLEFRQAAIRSALYASLVAFKRRILHERTAQRIAAETLEAETLEGEPAAHGAHHALLGEHWEILGERACASEAFRRAGDRLFEAGDFRAAGEHYARALAHRENGTAGRLALQQLALKCYVKTADWGQLIPLARAALETVDRRADPATAELLLSDLFLAYLNDGDRDDALRVAAEMASLELPSTVARAQIATFILTNAWCYQGRVDEARRLLHSIDPADVVDWEAQLRYLIARAETGALHEPIGATLTLVDEAAALAQPRAIRGTALCYSAGNEIALRYGALDKGREYLERAAAVAERSEGARNDVKLSIVKDRLRTHALAGELASARELLRENLEWHASGRHNEAFDSGLAVMVGMHTGDLALVDAFFNPELLYASAAARDAESCGHLFPGFAEVMTVRGMGKELRRTLERCVDAEMVDAYVAIQLNAIRYADVPFAERALQQVERYLGDTTAPAAPAHLALCRATLRRRQHGSAPDLAREAAKRFRRMGWRLYEAIALELAGEIAAATRAYDRCGATADVARLTATQTRKRKRAPFGARLTPRELEVARLIARKRSNAEIARALGVSTRTVDHHVEAAFSKLGIRARWQLTPDLLVSS
jgi:DNA-binding CsgD family transcriptional regulator